MADDKAVLWIPFQAMDLQVRLIVCAYMKETGPRRVTATFQGLEEYCYCSQINAQVTYRVPVPMLACTASSPKRVRWFHVL